MAEESASPGPKPIAIGVVPYLVGIMLIGTLDVSSGPELSLTPAYVLFVAASAWLLPRRAALFLALLCALTGVMAEHLIKLASSELAALHGSPLVPWVNGAARLTVYWVLISALSALRRASRERDATLAELSAALSKVQTLEGLLPICAWCKRIRDEQRSDSWVPLERFVAQRTAAEFTHGICPECARELEERDPSLRR